MPLSDDGHLYKPANFMTDTEVTKFLKIQEVETLVGITKKNIRFYEQEGLLHPNRKENGYRDYSTEDVDELKKIKFLRSLSFPLEEIRQMQAGTLTVADGARRHLIVLEREQHSLEKAQLLCSELIEQPQLLEQLDTDALLKKMQEMEKEGAVFMNVKKQDHRRQYIAPVIASATIIFLMALILFILFSETLTAQLSIGVIVTIFICAALLLVIIIGMILALLQRIRQIKGGEEDAASKY